jgi:hypothetical protein
MPDNARRSLFAEHKLIGGPRAYNGGTGGFISSEQDVASYHLNKMKRRRRSIVLPTFPLDHCMMCPCCFYIQMSGIKR